MKSIWLWSSVALLAAGIYWLNTPTTSTADTATNPRVMLRGVLVSPPYEVSAADGSLWINDLCADSDELLPVPAGTASDTDRDRFEFLDSLTRDFANSIDSGSTRESAIASRNSALETSSLVEAFEIHDNGGVTIHFKEARVPVSISGQAFNVEYLAELPTASEVEASIDDALDDAASRFQELLDAGGYLIVENSGSVQGYSQRDGEILFESIEKVVSSSESQEAKSRRLDRLVLDPAITKSVLENYVVE